MSRRVYLVLFVVLLAAAVTGVYLRQRAKATLRQSSGQAATAAANCDTPAPPPPPKTPPPKLPGFAIDAGCGPGAEAPKATPAAKAKGK
jgi:hypothetical protein